MNATAWIPDIIAVAQTIKAILETTYSLLFKGLLMS